MAQDYATENQSILGIRVSYGAYTGGDIPGMVRPGYPAWQDIETPVAQAVGAVEVAAVNHHGNRDSTNAFFVSALQPRLWILQVWSSDHPGHDVLDHCSARAATSSFVWSQAGDVSRHRARGRGRVDAREGRARPVHLTLT